MDFVLTKNDKWIWIELIGFDNMLDDFGVKKYIEHIGFVPNGISMFLFNCDFVNLHNGLQREEKLFRGCSSYNGHRYNEDREYQIWTNFQVSSLIKEIQKYGIKVYISFFDMFQYDTNDNYRINTQFSEMHPELLFHYRNSDIIPIYNVLKRFKDNTYYEDFLFEQTRKVLIDYGFDGIHIADGISNSRFTLENGDFSDDIVKQFIEYGYELPEKYLVECDNDQEFYKERANYIMKYKKLDWIHFFTDRWSKYYDKFSIMLLNCNKESMFNDAWSRDPFEAIYRYGIDYKKIYRKNIDSIMVQDCSACSITYSDEDQGGFQISMEERYKKHYESNVMQMSLKSYLPELKQFNMCPTKDTNEQWDVIRCVPTEFDRAVYRANSSFIISDKKYVKVTEGPVVCLGDGLSKYHWEKINQSWDLSFLSEVKKTCGAVAIFDEGIIYKEVEEFIKNKTLNSSKILSELKFFGADISSMATIKDLDFLEQPIVVCNPHLLSSENYQKILSYSKSAIIFVGTNIPQNININNYYECGIYHCCIVNGEIEKNQIFEFDFNQSTEIEHGEIWTQTLNYQRPSNEFFKSSAQLINSLIEGGKIFDKSNCNVSTIKLADNKFRFLIANENPYHSLPEIITEYKHKKLTTLTKYHGYENPQIDHAFKVRAWNRNIEIVDMEVY